MTDTKQTYSFNIERDGDDLRVVEYRFPEDEFGKKLMAVLLYQIAEHLDPAMQEVKTQ
jgi:hypothetical protein